MTAGPSARAEDIFYDLLNLDGPQRDAALDAACAGDTGLRAEVRALLIGHEAAGGFLETGRVRAQAGVEEIAPLKAGVRVGGYTIVEVLGVGGMGVVYVAEQDRPRRTVALKVIRRAAAGIVRRFEHEAEMLGRLQHPGIAHIFEAGAAEVDGRGSVPFISMELVRGRTLTEHARNLPVRERLALMARVCQAVHHAHQRGIIHRDLKPGNILVDERGQPKVLDFGVARATDSDLTIATLNTGVGQIVGTLQYMSPEQVRADPAQIDVRSDVYALGVILYEMLTGRPPHDLSHKSLPQAARIICDDPAPRIGEHDRSMRGDLEVVVCRAMEKERDRRYPSAAELGEDLTRFLEGRPIVARDDSALYLLRKRLRRYRGTLGLAGVSIVALAGLAAYALMESGRNQKLVKSREKANAETLLALKAAKEAREGADLTSRRLATELASSTIERGRLSARSGAQSAAEDLIWPVLLGDPASLQAHWALWDVYSRQPCLATVKAHNGGVWSVAFSADGASLFTGGADGALNVWDVASGARAFTLAVHTEEVTDLCADKGLVVTGSRDGDIAMTDLALRSVRKKIAGAHTRGVKAVALSPSGTRLVSVGGEGTVKVWDTRTGAQTATLAQYDRALSDVAWSPDGRFVAWCTLGDRSTLEVWDSQTSDIRTLPGNAGDVTTVAFSADGTRLASAGQDRFICFWDPATGEQTGRIQVPSGVLRTLQFAPDARSIMAGGWWSTDIWNIESGELVRTLAVRIAPFSNAISPDGGLIASGFDDGWVRFWDNSGRGAITQLPRHGTHLESTISPDGRLMATGDTSGVVRVWGVQAPQLLATLPPFLKQVGAIVFSPEGDLLLAGATDGSVRLFDLTSGRVVSEFSCRSSEGVIAAAFSDPGGRLAVAQPDGTVTIRRTADMVVERTLPVLAKDITSMAFSPDARLLVATATDMRVRVMDLADGAVRTLAEGDGAWSAQFSPDGTMLEAVAPSKGVVLWETRDWKPAGVLKHLGAPPLAFRFIPGQATCGVVAMADGVLRLWDARAGQELVRLDGIGAWEAKRLSVSADGRMLGTSGVDGSASILDLSRFDRCIAGNLEFQIARLGDEAPQPESLAQLRSWASATLAGHARAPVAGVDPEVVKAWGSASK